MVSPDLYAHLGLDVSSEQNLIAGFVSTLLGSNRSPSFFVDWKKVRKNVANSSVMIAEISKVSNSSVSEDSIRNLLLENPTSAKILPMLIAWRDDRWTTLITDSSGRLETRELDFSGKTRLESEDLQHVLTFCREAGILDLLQASVNFESYLLGVEVGMDTNARKNRSGTFMEKRLEAILKQAIGDLPGWTIVGHPSTKRLAQAGHQPPSGLSGRTFDYALISTKRRIAVETNFYDDLGSKPQEIVDSYIHRSELLARDGWEFVWVTDGPAWSSAPSQLQKAFSQLSVIFNLELCRRGGVKNLLLKGS